MGKQRRTRIWTQRDELSQLIHEEPEAIKVEAAGLLTTPDQMDKLLLLIRTRATSPKARNKYKALQS